MADIMIVARFNVRGFHVLDVEEVARANAQARTLFGGLENGPSDKVNWVYIGTPKGKFGGWVAIITEESFDNFSSLLRGAFSKIFDFEIYHLNRAHLSGAEGEVSAVATMVPAGNDWK